MTKEIKTVGWIGSGVMGAAMAGHLLNAGLSLRVHTRTRGKAEQLIGRGATWAPTPAHAADGADVVISIVGNPEDVRECHLGDVGSLSAATLPRYLIDMTTSRPSLAEEIAIAAGEKGVGAIDAPVSGGDIGARDATLSIMVGAKKSNFDAVHPILKIMGRTVVRQGGPGAGQHTKMVNQILIAGTMMSVCEGLLYARRAGLDPNHVIESVGSGAAGSWAINNLGPRILREDFSSGFYVVHFIKDLGIALDESSRMGLAVPGLALARQMYEAVAANGWSREGTQVLYKLLDRLNGA